MAFDFPFAPLPYPVETGAPGISGGFVWAKGGEIRSPFVLFLPDGRVGGSAAGRIARWCLGHGGGLCLTAPNGAMRTLPAAGSDFAFGDESFSAGRAWPIRALGPLRQARRNLVVLRAGDQSLHPSWLETMGDEERSWDLCLSYYGSDPEAARGEAEYFIPQKGSKFGGLAALIAAESFVFDYERIWFPDDDLLIDGTDINRLFATAGAFDLALAQPSLVPGCFINHRITEQQPQTRVRFTSFVEIMAPLFTREALAIVAPSFGFNASGYGLDHLWPALLGAAAHRVGVIDEVAMIHTRPMGANYDIEGAAREGWDALDGFGLRQLYASYGGIMKTPAGWSRERGGPGQMIG